ncbi:MAG TPA: NUDIX hydrolase [Pseudonocardiaceae bacterium]|nr:NUDIX hydrolase [Pseudonocardiaceae bacterium]
MSGKNTPHDNSRYSARETTPWRRLSSSLVHTTRWFVVRQDDVLRPDGSAGVYERVDSRGAVTVLAIDDDDHVAITRQWIYLHENTQWRLPGGGIDVDDATPLDAAKRELAEETGLRAGRWTSMGRINCADSLTNHVDHLFLATGLTQGEPRLDACEADLRVVRLPFSYAVTLAMNDQVPDAGSAHALVMYAARRAGIGAGPVDADYLETG